MAHVYPIEVQSDFLDKITRAKPIQALAEFIWNALDADATKVEVLFEYNELGRMSAIVVRDNGQGLTFSDAPELFKKLGGSWKKPGGTTKGEGRFLHGQEGRGRFRAFALGAFADWDVTYLKDGERWTFAVSMNGINKKEVSISDEKKVVDGKPQGVVARISELERDFRALTSDSAIQELTETLALYLSDYKHVSVIVDGKRLNPDDFIASRYKCDLPNIFAEDTSYECKLEIIEWRAATNRILYLCNEKGFPLTAADRRFHVGNFQFSAYLKSTYLSKMQRDGDILLAELRTETAQAIEQAYEAIKDFFRTRAAEEAKSTVTTWKEENIYPYESEPTTRVEQVERQVFDIVAVNVANFVPDFQTTHQKSKALHLRLLRQAIEKSPDDLQLILGEVLKLPQRKQEELAGLLRDVSLSAIISAAKIIADRLKFLKGLEAIIFDSEPSKRLKERSQLHRIVAENCWLFGEQYNISVNDQGLTEVLRQHLAALKIEAVVDEPVKHITQSRGIVDLMLTRLIRNHKPNDLTHLVVELKAPKVPINDNEIQQLEKYAFSVADDSRFRGVGTRWVFWAISKEVGKYAEYRILDEHGTIHEKDNIRIFVKTWAQLLDDNRARLQFFAEKLEYQADKSASLAHLQEHYAQFLEGVFVAEEEDRQDAKPADSVNEIAKKSARPRNPKVGGV